MASFRNHAAIVVGVAAVIFCMGSEPVWAADGKNVSQPDTQAIEKIIRDYLLKNPKIVVDALEAHKRHVDAQEELAVLRTIKARRKELQYDPGSVVGGNLSGDVTVVEFF